MANSMLELNEKTKSTGPSTGPWEAVIEKLDPKKVPHIESLHSRLGALESAEVVGTTIQQSSEEAKGIPLLVK